MSDKPDVESPENCPELEKFTFLGNVPATCRMNHETAGNKLKVTCCALYQILGIVLFSRPKGDPH